jgi:hypothetical protein
MSTEVLEAIENIPAFGRRDAEAEADRIVDSVIQALRRDPTVPQRSFAEWELVLADLRIPLSEQLAEGMTGLVDIDEVLATVTVTM